MTLTVGGRRRKKGEAKFEPRFEMTSDEIEPRRER